MAFSHSAMEALVILTTHMVEFPLDGKIMMKMISKIIEEMTLETASLFLPLQKMENTSLNSLSMTSNTKSKLLVTLLLINEEMTSQFLSEKHMIVLSDLSKSMSLMKETSSNSLLGRKLRCWLKMEMSDKSEILSKESSKVITIVMIRKTSLTESWAESTDISLHTTTDLMTKKNYWEILRKTSRIMNKNFPSCKNKERMWTRILIIWEMTWKKAKQRLTGSKKEFLTIETRLKKIKTTLRTWRIKSGK